MTQRIRPPFLWIFTICSLVIGTRIVSSRPMPHYGYWKKVQDIARDLDSPQRRTEAVAALLKIAQDGAENPHLRRFAVEKLAELGATETAESLKALAEQLQWTDETRQLKRAASLAYWKIRVSQEKTARQQEGLLINLLWPKNHPPPHADVIPWWAAEELANRGVKEALPEIEKSIMFWNPTAVGKQFIQLCSIKIRLINSYTTRLEALQNALENSEDPSVSRQLRYWAIAELAKLNTEQARAVLINHALALQQTHYDRDYRPKAKQIDQVYMDAAGCYNEIIEVLRGAGMDQRQANSLGLRPDKCFVIAP